MIFYHPRSFGEAALLNLTLLLAILVPALIYSERKPEVEPTRLERKIAPHLNIAITALSILILVSGVLPLNSYRRLITYFVLQGIAAGLVAYTHLRGLLRRDILLFYIFTAIVSIPALVYYHNQLYPLYNVTKEALYRTGTIRQYMEESARGGFYYYIPVAPLLTVQALYVISTKLSALMNIVEPVAFYATISLAAIASMKRLGLASIALIPLMYVTTPNLAFQYRILSLPYAMLFIYLVLRHSEEPRTATVIAAVITSTTMVFSHPVGPLAIMTMLLVLLIVADIYAPQNRQLIISTRVMLGLVASIALTYWFSTYIYTLLVPKATNTINALMNFINTILGRTHEAKQYVLGETINIINAPGYGNPKFYKFAYNWATPIALAITALLATLWKLRKRSINKEDLVIIATAITGLGYLTAAYIGYVFNIEPGQYMIPIGYFAATIAAAISLQKYKPHIPLIVIACVIALAVGLGTYTPSWAPIEHPDFQAAAKIHPATSYVESHVLQKLIKHITIYNDYDLLLYTAEYGEYKDIRKVITYLESGENPFNLRGSYYTLFVLRTERLKRNPNLVRLEYLADQVYISRNHIAYGVR